MNRRKSAITLLAISSTISVLLCVCRMFWLENIQFSNLLWNLFLAWIPFLIANQMRKQQAPWIHYVLFLIWLPFLPNAPYIVTDLVHLHKRTNLYLYWYDMLLIFAFAWNGLLLGFLSLNRMHLIFLKHLKPAIAWCSMFAVLLLCGYGVYLGRFSRFNTWDILNRPHHLFSEIYSDFRYPLLNIEAFAFALVTALLMLACYLSLVVFKSYNHGNR